MVLPTWPLLKWGFDSAQMSRNEVVGSGVPSLGEHRHITQVLGTRGPWAGGTGGIGRSWGWVQSQPGTPCSNTASPPSSGAAAAGGRGAGLPRPGPPLPALLLLLAVLPAAQERGAPGRRLLLHRLVRHHRHAGLQVSARGAAGPSGAWSDWKRRGVGGARLEGAGQAESRGGTPGPLPHAAPSCPSAGIAVGFYGNGETSDGIHRATYSLRHANRTVAGVQDRVSGRMGRWGRPLPAPTPVYVHVCETETWACARACGSPGLLPPPTWSRCGTPQPP